MSNPTSNFNWQMPQNSDLVTDLPADFEVFGQAVDTTFADLKGGTTGQILSKASNTDMDFTWAAATSGDITGVTAGTGISGGGTSGDVTITNSMATAIDAKGDLIVGTGADAFSRLAIGSNDQVLTADSTTATGTKWAAVPASNSMTSLASGSYTGTALNITGLSTSYNTLIIQVNTFDPSTGTTLRIRFNNDATGKYVSSNSNNLLAANFNSTYFENLTYNQNATDTRFFLRMECPNYATSNGYKAANAHSFSCDTTTTADVNGKLSFNCYNSTSAISQVNIFEGAGGTFSINYQIWGVK